MSKTAKNKRQKAKIERQGIAIRETIELGNTALQDMAKCDVDYNNMLAHNYTPPLLREQAK